MTRFPSRVTALAVSISAAGALLSATSPTAAAVDSCSPVGAWSVIAGYDDVSFTATITYRYPNVAVLSDGPAPGGKGRGHWKMGDDCTFSARIKEISSQDGEYLGHVDIRYTATISGDTYSATGRSVAYDADGEVLRSVASHQTAVRD